jgi:hypothetical protein
MPDINPDKSVATAYPPDPLYQSWTTEAEARNMTLSRFMIKMIEVGREQIDIRDLATDSLRELRQQRSDLREQVEQKEARIQKLEQALHRTAYADIIDFVEANPGVTTPEVIQHVADSVPTRVVSHLDIVEGDVLEQREDGYYVLDANTRASQLSPAANQLVSDSES